MCSFTEEVFTNGAIQQIAFSPFVCRNCIISVSEANPGKCSPSIVSSRPNCVMLKRKSLYATSHGESKTSAETGMRRRRNWVTAYRNSPSLRQISEEIQAPNVNGGGN